MKLNSKNLFDSYCRGWHFYSEGNKSAKNDLAGVRRTRTALKGLLSDQFQDVLQPEHVLALRAAASVLDELDSTIASIITPLKVEQQRRHDARAKEALAAIDEYIAARPGEPWFQSEAAAAAELALLDEFEGSDGQAWLCAAKGAKRSDGHELGRSRLHTPDAGPDLNKRQRLAVRLSKIAPTGRLETHTFNGLESVWASWGTEDFRLWKSLRAHADSAIEKAKAGV